MNPLKPLCLAVAVAVSGCSYIGLGDTFRDRSDDYLKAEEQEVMQIPEGAAVETFDELYRVPKVSATENNLLNEEGEFEVPRPVDVAVNVHEEKVKIQRLGSDRWVMINSSPSEVWPRVRSWLASNNIYVVFADASQGVIETAWLRFGGDTERKDKFQVRVEQGVQINSTEIHVTHLNVPADDNSGDDVDFPETSTDIERETWLIDSLANSIASREVGGAASMVAQAIGGEAKVELMFRDVVEPYMVMDLDFRRAWATLATALTKGGFQSVEQNRDNGVVQVTFLESRKIEEEERGFLGSLFSSRGPEDKPEAFRVQIRERGAKVEVRFLSESGTQLSKLKAEQMLRELRNTL